jgi:prolipoprotein diacylglyceryltransferase
MYPVIFYLFGHPVRSWGVMVALGVLAGLWVTVRLARKERIDPLKVLDFVLYAVMFGFLGTRLCGGCLQLGKLISWNIIPGNFSSVVTKR